jgi:hypothetical protein
MKIPGRVSSNGLPADRGRYLLRLSPPWVQGESHFVHFSWLNESFCIRDYMQHLECRQSGDVTATSIWQAAEERIPAIGEFFKPVENHEFWTARLTELSRGGSTHWSTFSSKFAKTTVPNETAATERTGAQDGSDEDCGDPVGNVYQRVRRLWSNAPGFEIVDGTVGCSARYRGTPLLWLFPTYFRVAPYGKGNVHEDAVRKLRNSHFPEMSSKGLIGFNSTYFSWRRLEDLVEDLRHLVDGR